MAWEMWERLGYREIDPSVLSRVINGERIFSQRQLDVFCEVLGLKPAKKEELTFVLSQDVLSRSGIEASDYLSVLDQLEYINECKKYIFPLEDAGNPTLAYDLATYLSEKAAAIAQLAKKQGSRIFALNLAARLEWEKGYSQTLLLLPKTAVRLTSDYWKKVRDIAVELKDEEIFNLAIMGRGFAYSVDENYNGAIRKVNRALSFIGDAEHKMKAFKVLAVNYGYSGKKEAFKNLCETANRFMDSQEIDWSCLVEVLDGMGRGGALLDNPCSEKYLEMSHKIVENLEKSGSQLVFRKIQLIRSELEIQTRYQKLGRNINKSAIEKKGRIGIELARNLSFERHVQKINNFMHELLD